jgi:peroxisomal 2,4-dienoyl-CoA reductase
VVAPLASCFTPDLLDGRTALVTGGATGIGKEICRVLGAHGARVAMASRKEENLAAAVDELRAEGVDARYEVVDVRDAPAVADAVASVLDAFGRLDIVVNNAAGNFPAPIEKITPNGFKAVVDIDLLGTYNVTKATVESWLRDHGGHIVNISAPFEMKGAALQAHVAAAKAGVDSLTRTCAVELGPHDIRVNAVAPGHISGTEGVRRFAAVSGADPEAGTRDDGSDEPRAGNPLGLYGHGTDIAYTVLFLCSPLARFISGQVIAVDGGSSVDQLKMGLGRT